MNIDIVDKKGNRYQINRDNVVYVITPETRDRVTIETVKGTIEINGLSAEDVDKVQKMMNVKDRDVSLKELARAITESLRIIAQEHYDLDIRKGIEPTILKLTIEE